MSFIVGIDQTYHIVIADWARDQDKIREIRTRVFIEEQQVPAKLEWDEEDEQCTHLLARTEADQAIGTARLLDTGQIGRLAVLKPYRGIGVGKAMLKKLLEVARDRNFNSVFLNSQTHAVDFYHGFGFNECGSSFNEAGISHCKMQKNIVTEN